MLNNRTSLYRGVQVRSFLNGKGRFYTPDIEYARLYGSYIIESEIDLSAYRCIYGDVYDMHRIIDAQFEWDITEPDIDIIVMDAGVTPGECTEIYMYSDTALQAVNANTTKQG